MSTVWPLIFIFLNAIMKICLFCYSHDYIIELSFVAFEPIKFVCKVIKVIFVACGKGLKIYLGCFGY